MALAAFAAGAAVTLYVVSRLAEPDAPAPAQAVPSPPSSSLDVAASVPAADSAALAGELPAVGLVPAAAAGRPPAEAGRAEPPRRRPPPRRAPAAGRTAPAVLTETPSAIPEDSLAELYADLRRRGLIVPVEGVSRATLRDQFGDPGGRGHRALDIVAPRHTPIYAVENGRIAKLDFSNAGGGGTAIYQVDPTGRYAYYYAHLQRWAPGLKEGDRVRRGQLIGYVGTSGNAPPDTPHLHFAILHITRPGGWRGGVPLNPYLVLGR